MASSDARAVALNSMISSSVRSGGSAWCALHEERVYVGPMVCHEVNVVFEHGDWHQHVPVAHVH